MSRMSELHAAAMEALPTTLDVLRVEAQGAAFMGDHDRMGDLEYAASVVREVLNEMTI